MPRATAMLRYLGRGVSGLVSSLRPSRMADESVRQARRMICRSNRCGAYQSTVPGGRCRVCGCQIAAKTRLADQSCPEGLWEAVSLTTSADDENQADDRAA